MRILAGLAVVGMLVGATAVWAGEEKNRYLPQVEAWEEAGVLDAEPHKLVAMFDTVISKDDPISCKELGAALTERDHLRAAAYLAVSYCPPVERGVTREPIKRAAEEMPNIDG